MSDLLDLAHTPPRHKRIVPDPHRLTVYEHPDDGMHVDHPDSCKREIVTFPSGATWTAYECVVQWHLDAVGPDHLYRHAFDEPYHSNDRRTPLLPGTYTFRYEATIWPQHTSMWDDSDPDEEIEAVPQGALDTGYYVPFKVGQRSLWSAREWKQVHDQHEDLGWEIWKRIVDVSEVTGTHPKFVAEGLRFAMNAYVHHQCECGECSPR